MQPWLKLKVSDSDDEVAVNVDVRNPTFIKIEAQFKGDTISVELNANTTAALLKTLMPTIFR